MAQTWLENARSALRHEAREVAAAAERLDDRFVEAVGLLSDCSGKVVVSGAGKSGNVAKQIAATLSSTGTPAVFLHPSDASHGDLGLCSPGDPVVMISNAGATAELLRLVGPLKDLGCPLIGILGRANSPLAKEMDVYLDASVEREADPENLIPTASSLVALAFGHALALALVETKGFSSDDFLQRHPGGQIGRNLRVRVGEAMHQGDAVAWVAPADSLKQVVIAMTRRPLGAACVVESARSLVGLITDGDLRRALERHDDIRQLLAEDVMTPNPVSVSPEAKLVEALDLMENRRSQIALLPVVDSKNGSCVGLIRLHDVCQGFLP